MMNLDYTVIRKPYRRNASITVSQDNRISVIVPKYLPDHRIQDMIREKSVWIMKVIEKNLKFQHLYKPKTYANGETFSYLGKDLRLSLTYDGRGEIRASEDEIHVPIPFPEAGYDHSKFVSSQLNQWGRMRAVRILKERVSFYEAVMNVKAAEVRVKKVESVWGSCNSKGNLTFNWRIVMAPIPVIDYVVVHELAHILHHNHSDRFWRQVESVIPDFRERRKWLRQNSRALKW